MEAAGGLQGLQRSEISFRRTGSSGLVWDDKFLGELAKIKPASQDNDDEKTKGGVPDSTEPRRASSAAPGSDVTTTLTRSRSDGGAGGRQQGQGYKTMKVPSPSLDPPSPKVSGCVGICSIFRNAKDQKQQQQPRKRVKVAAGKRKV